MVLDKFGKILKKLIISDWFSMIYWPNFKTYLLRLRVSLNVLVTVRLVDNTFYYVHFFNFIIVLLRFEIMI